MENLSDIESIIKTQLWKTKSKSHQNSPTSNSMTQVSIFSSSKVNSTQNSTQNSSQNSLEEPATEGLSPVSNSKDRIMQLVKLAVPYKVLYQAIEKVLSRKIDPCLIPVFPMRGFGKKHFTEVKPKFEIVRRDFGLPPLRQTEIVRIKEKAGRTKSFKPQKLPPLYSPRAAGSRDPEKVEE